MTRTKQKLCSCLPDCMMPDGGDPCGGYLKLYDEIDGLEARIAALEKVAEAARNTLLDVDRFRDEELDSDLIRTYSLASALSELDGKGEKL